jgi:SAM-dependent methyltransferase
MLRHHAALWERWARLTAILRTGQRGKDVSGFRGSAADARAFTMAMRDGARRFATGVAEELPLKGRRLLLDLGGGPGAYAAAFLRRHPRLRVLVVDLPDVCTAARELAAEEWDFGDRLAWHAADLDVDPLPEGADAAFLSHVIHSQSEGEIAALFTKIRDALEPGGLLVVRDFFTSKARTHPPSASLFALNMLVNTAEGRAYSTSETRDRLRAAGFRSAVYRSSKVAPDAGYVIARS